MNRQSSSKVHTGWQVQGRKKVQMKNKAKESALTFVHAGKQANTPSHTLSSPSPTRRFCVPKSLVIHFLSEPSIDRSSPSS